MIVADNLKCVGCGLCVRICHEQCISIFGSNGRHEVHIDHSICSTCTQCVAICSRQALSWDDAQPVPFEKAQLPSTEQLEELLKQRRTVRRFKKRRIDRGLLGQIVTSGIYAPTNNYHLQALVIVDPAVMESLDEIIMGYVRWVYNLLYRFDFVFNILRRITPEVHAKNRVKMRRSVEKGVSMETLPAAIIIVVGDRRITLSEASAQYAMYNMMLYAQTRGIGSRINAAGPLVLDRSRAARKCLGLQKREHILGMFELGYPVVQFRNKVEGKRMPITWNTRSSLPCNAKPQSSF